MIEQLQRVEEISGAGLDALPNEVVTGASLLERTVARVQSWFGSAPQRHVVQAPTAHPVHLVPVPEKALPASADPYAGMIVLVRGPKAPCSLDAA